MSTKVQVQTQAKTPGAPVAARIPQPRMGVTEREADRPDIATQLEGASRLGHSFATLGMDDAAAHIIQRQELPEEDEEELQMRREAAAVQRQELPEEEEEELQMKRESAALQRQESPEEEEEELQTKPASDLPRQGQDGSFQLDDETAGRIKRARGGGQPLAGVLQAQMSATLGHDFSGVRVHSDAEADAFNRQLRARAFTTGRDIFFRRDEYNPGASGGRKLLAHELSHVVQQSAGWVPGGGSGMIVRAADDIFEHKADLLANYAVSEHAVNTAERAGPDGLRGICGKDNTNTIQRKERKHKLLQKETDAPHKLGRVLGTTAAWVSIIPIAGPVIAAFLSTAGQTADWRHEVSQSRESRDTDKQHGEEIHRIKKRVSRVQSHVERLDESVHKLLRPGAQERSSGG